VAACPEAEPHGLPPARRVLQGRHRIAMHTRAFAPTQPFRCGV